MVPARLDFDLAWGATWDEVVTLSSGGVRQDLTGCTVLCQVRTSHDAPTVAFEFEMDLQDQVDAETRGKVDWFLSAKAARKIPLSKGLQGLDPTVYYYDLRVIFADGTESVIYYGDIRVIPTGFSRQ
jgi:hypothetical protein